MATNILLTGMLVVRLLYMRHQVMKIIDRSHGKTYTNIVSMILESAAIYGVISFIFLVLYIKGNTAALLFIPLLTQVQVSNAMILRPGPNMLNVPISLVHFTCTYHLKSCPRESVV